jgi:two-component system sensor histidine kinase KdpD
MARVWIGLGDSIGEERVVADTRPGEPRPSVASRWILHPSSSETQPTWVKVRESAIARPGAGAETRELRLRQLHDDEPLTMLRVPITVGGQTIGSLWAAREKGDPFPGRSHSRLIGAAADQLGQSVVRDRLAAEATAVEVARQGDALKSALLDSVSHDLRTPLAAIRAAAGNLMDPDVALKPDDARSIAGSIDQEAERLSRLVRNMLDLGRIEGGALHPSLELYDLADLVDPVVERMSPLLVPSPVEVSVPADLPAVQVDAMFVDQILTNLLENAGRYAAGKQIRVSAKTVGGQVWLIVEDAGPGVAAAAIPHLFERFYRVPRSRGSRTAGGSGIGLAVVKGFAEAMGGSAVARPSALGGLEVIVRLPIEYEPKATDLVESTEATEPSESNATAESTDGDGPTEPPRPTGRPAGKSRILMGPE